MGNVTDKIDYQQPEIDDWLDVVDLPCTLLGGTRAMQAAGKKYLPQHPLEKKLS